MPRSIDLPREQRRLERAVSKGTPLRRQYVLKLNPDIAILLVRNCLDERRAIGPRLEEIVENYYTTWDEGVHLQLPPTLRSMLEDAARLLNVSRETVVLELVRSSLPIFLSRVISEEQNLRKVIQEVRKLPAASETKPRKPSTLTA